MELRHLRYFVAVAEELSFTRAAHRLHIAQPPLSTQIRSLEDELGARLFVRDRRRVFLTQAGKAMLGRAREVLEAAQAAQSVARNVAAGHGGRVTLGYTASAIFTSRLPGVLRRFRRSHPSIEMDLREMTSLEQVDALHARSLDVGILRKPEAAVPPGVEIEPWYVAPLVAAIPADHRLARRRRLGVEDLDDEPVITYPRDAGIGLYWQVLRLFAGIGARPRIVREAREPGVMIGLVSAGVGIAIVPDDIRCIRLQGVSYRALASPEAVSTLFLGYRRPEIEPPVQQLLAALRGRRRDEGGDRYKANTTN